MILEDYQSFIEDTLARASETARQFFGKVITGTVKGSDPTQVVTEADLEIGALIVEGIRKKFSGHNIIDEESGLINNGSEITWVVDPIDGTSNFVEGLPFFGIMLGVLEQNHPIAGGVSLPLFEELYLGGGGSVWRNGKRMNWHYHKKSLSSALIAYGIDGHRDEPDQTRTECKLLADIVLAIRNLRSTNSVYDLVAVVNGKYGAFLNQTSKIWDNVAPQAIVEALGGVYTDFYGRPIDYSDALTNPGRNYTFCVGSPEVHTQIQQIIHSSSGHFTQ